MALVGHTHVIEEHLVSVRFFVGIYIMPHKHLCEPFLSLESYCSIHLFHISKCDVSAYSKYHNNYRLVIEKIIFHPSLPHVREIFLWQILTSTISLDPFRRLLRRK